METHAIEGRDPARRLELRAMEEPPKVTVDLLRCRASHVETANHYHRELEPLRLMDGHHLDVTLREGLIRILVFVDPALVEETKEAVEEMETEVLTVPRCYDGVVVVVLEGVHEL